MPNHLTHKTTAPTTDTDMTRDYPIIRTGPLGLAQNAGRNKIWNTRRRARSSKKFTSVELI
jgi:hypothetical protein